MDITTKSFERAIEIAYLKGLNDNLANMLTPQELENRLQKAILEAYAAIQTEKEKITMDETELAVRFSYHPPAGGQPEKYEALRAKALDFAIELHKKCPSSRELSLAITKLEECVFWANAAIARRMF